MSLLDHFTDYSPALRCSTAESIGRITQKAFLKDVGFGDCAMRITYDFSDARGHIVAGKHSGTESSYYGVQIGDMILIQRFAWHYQSGPARLKTWLTIRSSPTTWA